MFKIEHLSNIDEIHMYYKNSNESCTFVVVGQIEPLGDIRTRRSSITCTHCSKMKMIGKRRLKGFSAYKLDIGTLWNFKFEQGMFEHIGLLF